VNNPTASSTSPHGLLILYLEAQQEDFFLWRPGRSYVA
jgi:hypothetical protein